ncbi:MAG TPA: hypothetical protein HPP87_10045 [Planctomycetes bacterium]|nr:hypothetical protein [Planctomycetota bacterium]
MAWGNLQQDKYRTEYLERVVQRLGAENAKLKEALRECTRVLETIGLTSTQDERDQAARALVYGAEAHKE